MRANIDCYYKHLRVRSQQSHIGRSLLYSLKDDLNTFGRVDCQVKINGLRIELGEIENAIKSVGNSVKDTAVVAAGNILVAFTSGSANARDLQEACRSKLPEYMVPKVYLTIEGEDGWPRTSSYVSLYSCCMLLLILSTCRSNWASLCA